MNDLPDSITIGDVTEILRPLCDSMSVMADQINSLAKGQTAVVTLFSSALETKKDLLHGLTLVHSLAPDLKAMTKIMGELVALLSDVQQRLAKLERQAASNEHSLLGIEKPD